MFSPTQIQSIADRAAKIAYTVLGLTCPYSIELIMEATGMSAEEIIKEIFAGEKVAAASVPATDEQTDDSRDSATSPK